MTIALTFIAPGGDEDDHAQGAVGKLTTEQIASFAPGLLDMEPVPTPTELKELATAAQDHPSVVLPAEILRALFAGTTHPDELLDQLDHPEAVAQQLNTRPGRSRQKPKRKVSRLGRLARLSTNTGYAAVVRSPLHQLAGIMTLPVNPRFLAAIQHAFTKGRTTDPTIEWTLSPIFLGSWSLDRGTDGRAGHVMDMPMLRCGAWRESRTPVTYRTCSGR